MKLKKSLWVTCLNVGHKTSCSNLESTFLMSFNCDKVSLAVTCTFDLVEALRALTEEPIILSLGASGTLTFTGKVKVVPAIFELRLTLQK